jgi:hypothetical protein
MKSTIKTAAKVVKELNQLLENSGIQQTKAWLQELPRLHNTQELTPLFVCWVTLAYTAMHRKVSAVF